jgi:hypothetical protein
MYYGKPPHRPKTPQILKPQYRTMPDRLDHLDDDAIIPIETACELLGFSQTQLELWALGKSFGLKSVAPKMRRQFLVRDLRAFLQARQRALQPQGDLHAKPHPAE